MKKIKLSYIYLAVFIIVAYIMLPIMNAPYLYALQEQSLFVNGRTFMQDTVQNHGGWMVWMSCYLTQFMYYPWLGSTMLIAMWVAIYFLCVHGLKIKDEWSFIALIPLLFRLFDVLDLGYRLYVAKSPGYAFESTLFLLAIAIIAWVLSLIFRRFISSKNTIHQLIAQSALLFVVAICPFIPSASKRSHGISTTMFDTNFRKELIMCRATEECRWDDVLAEAPLMSDTKADAPTSLMVLLKNIALTNTDQLLDKMCDYNNCGQTPDIPDSTNVSLARQAGSLVYLHYGYVNYAYRWAIENSVKYYFTASNLKMLIRCATFNQEYDVALKYIAILKGTTFYRSWAKQWEKYVFDGQFFAQSQEYQSVFPLMAYDNILDSDSGNVFQYLLEHFTNMNTSNPRFEELALTFALLAQAPNEFMINFYYFYMNHQDITMPRILEEAAYMFSQQEECPIDMSGYPFDQITIKDKYDQFATQYQQLLHKGMDIKEIGENLRSAYGNTYWWYFYFYTELNLY